jgi:hypothetical protein
MAFGQFVQPAYGKVNTENTIRTPKSSPKKESLTITPKLMSQPINAFNITMNQGIPTRKRGNVAKDV